MAAADSLLGCYYSCGSGGSCGCYYSAAECLLRRTLKQNAHTAGEELRNMALYARAGLKVRQEDLLPHEIPAREDQTPDGEIPLLKSEYGSLKTEIDEFESRHYKPMIAAHAINPTLRNEKPPARWLVACNHIEKDQRATSAEEKSEIISLEQWREAVLRGNDEHASGILKHHGFVIPAGEVDSFAFYAAERRARILCSRLSARLYDLRIRIDAVGRTEYKRRRQQLDFGISHRFGKLSRRFSRSLLAYEMSSPELKAEMKPVFDAAQTAVYDRFYQQLAKATSDDVVLRSGPGIFHYEEKCGEIMLNTAEQIAEHAIRLIENLKRSYEQAGMAFPVDPNHPLVPFFNGERLTSDISAERRPQAVASELPTLRAGRGGM